MVNAAAKAKIVILPVRRNISVLEGSGGNIAVLKGKDGKVLTDAGFAVSRAAIANALKSINTDPITHLINTHWHTDHTDGNAWLHDAGAAITAHENTRKRLTVATRVEGWHWTFPAAPVGALPTEVFQTERELQLNDTRIAMKYYGPAHTDSDVWVHFTDADVIHVGDTWWNGVYPLYRLLDGWQHRWPDSGGGEESLRRDRQDDSDSWSRLSWRQGRHERVSRHAVRSPRKCRRTQKTGPLLAGHHRRPAHREI